MPGLLGSLYSQGNVAKRKLADLLGNPIESLQQIIGYGVDRAKAFDELSQKATDEYLATKSFKGPYQNQLSDLMAEAYNPVGMTVWHGSPHKFSKFDSSKIGTGEGAQAYGHGLYLAESKDVAGSYAVNLANRDMANQGRLNAHANAQRLVNLTGNPKYAADDLKFVLESQPDHPQKKLLTDTLQMLESGDYAKPLKTTGSLYKVDLPDEQIAKMLDWDKPLSEQHPDVQAALTPKNLGWNQAPKPFDDRWVDQKGVLRTWDNPTGEEIVKSGMAGQEISEQLKSMGIPGIRYLDQGSRGAGQGTSNFVVFPGNEELLKILERNGGLLD